jgi:hypothetical protein
MKGSDAVGLGKYKRYVVEYGCIASVHAFFLWRHIRESTACSSAVCTGAPCISFSIKLLEIPICLN